MFPIEEIDDRCISPTTILKLLATEDGVRFSTLLKKTMLCQHIFRIQADGGDNFSVTPNRDILHTSWNILPYKIVGIGNGIGCTAKGVFHMICED